MTVLPFLKLLYESGNSVKAVYVSAWFLGVAAVLFLLYAFVLLFPGAKKERIKKFRYFFTDYAHRGLWGDGIPENSLTAFSRAAEKGFGTELDVRLSKDGKVFVFHDDNLLRMTGIAGKFSDFTAKEIEQLCLAGTGEKIPYFTEVLSAVRGRVPIMVELKGETSDTALCVAVDRILRDYDGEYCVESFNPLYVGWYRKNRAEIMRGQLVCGNKKPLSTVCDLLVFNIYNRPDFISYKYSRYNRTALCLATRLWNAERAIWTVRDGETRKRFKNAAVIFEGFIPERK